MVAIGHIEGGNIHHIIKNAGLNKTEEAQLWHIFHKLWPSASSRDSDEINSILRTHELIEKNIHLFGKISVLDIGCGKNGNGISTLTAKYANKVKGFGIDLDIQDHPSNVKLIEGSAKDMPFSDNSFILVYACHVVYYFLDESINELLTEVLRVLKPGGMFVFDDGRRINVYQDKIIPSTGFSAKVMKHRGTKIKLIVKE